MRREQRERRQASLQQLMLPALTALIIFVATLSAIHLARQVGNIAAIWFPNGILLAMLMIRADRATTLLAAGALASLAANFTAGHSAASGLVITSANMLEVGFAAWAIRRWAGSASPFAQVHGVVRFTLVAGFAAPVIGATVAATGLGLFDSNFLAVWTRWVVGDALGLLIFAPIIVILDARLRHGPDAILSLRTRPEVAALLAGFGAVTFAVFSLSAEPALFLLPPLALVVTFRMGSFGAATASLIVAAIGTWLTVHGAGPIAQYDGTGPTRILDFQLFLAALFLCALPVAAALSERQALATELAAACDAARQAAESFYDQASTDELTGVATRRRFLERLREEIAAARVRGTELALVVIDVDHFKSINDAHGHPAGDAVLRALADLCRATTRAGDTIGRLGGEEFAMLMPGVGRDAAVTVCERLRRAVETHRVEPAPGVSIATTVSLGLAMCGGQDSDRALADADRALYEAKRSGRNRLAIAA